MTINNTKLEAKLLMLCLYIFVFSVAFVTTKHSRDNAVAISLVELAFICSYLALLRKIPPVVQIVKSNPAVSLLFLLWVISVTYSFLSSPYSLVDKPYAFERYAQTIMHAIAYIFMWDIFRRRAYPSTTLFYLISLSTIFIVFFFMVNWFVLTNLMVTEFSKIETIWTHAPPFNSHIVHTRYQATAGLAIFLLYFVESRSSSFNTWTGFFALTILWSFLFWLGGRGPVLSVFGAIFFLWGVLRLKNSYSRDFLYFVLGSALIGLFIGESVAIFSWSGMMHAVGQSVAADSINQLSSNRIVLWMGVLESVKDHWAFGLGPQGYYYMPNRIPGTIQPHNVFMQFLVEWGVVGGFLLTSMLLRGFWIGFKRHVLDTRDTIADISKVALAAGTVIVSLSILALFDGTYYLSQPSYYLVVAFAIWVNPSPASIESKTSEVSSNLEIPSVDSPT